MKRKICVVTGSRAEYGLLRWIMQGIKDEPSLSLQVIATGMHLSPEFGLTYRDIAQDGFYIDRKVESLLSSDTAVGVTKSIGLGMIGFADVLNELQPDMLVLLGDRFELLSAATAALIARIPIAHVHGGETTEGAFDEAIRHSITKMSHLHFVAAEEYRQRVIQLGESPERVFMVGGVGIDNIKRLQLLDRNTLEKALDFTFGLKNLLVTFHPVTLEQATATRQMEELLKALAELPDTNIIFTSPNADTDNRALTPMIQSFVAHHNNSAMFTSLGQLRYLSCLQHVDAVVGNSSSGLVEAPTFKKGTINIGSRQSGRLKAASVIDCEPTREEISSALKKLYSAEFQQSLATVKNLYGEGGASSKIVQELARVPLEGLVNKTFFDIKSQ